jgi:hypothetical protein
LLQSINYTLSMQKAHYANSTSILGKYKSCLFFVKFISLMNICINHGTFNAQEIQGLRYMVAIECPHGGVSTFFVSIYLLNTMSSQNFYSVGVKKSPSLYVYISHCLCFVHLCFLLHTLHKFCNAFKHS